MENIIPQEVAEADFDRFVEAMDLFVDPAFMDDEDRTAFEKQKHRLVNAMMIGALSINENGEAVYTPRRSDYKDPITFHERTGASLMAMDNKKKNQDIAKTYAVMADMTNTHPGVFSKLKGSDIKTCEAIFALLMD